MSTTTAAPAPPTPATKRERDLVALCRRISDLERLNDKKVHLFSELREDKVTQARIGALAGMSDVGVALAIKRHHKRHEKGVAALAVARDPIETAEAQSLVCLICAGSADA